MAHDILGQDADAATSVSVTSLPALPAGTNNIGDVDVLTLPALPAGTNNIGDIDVLTLPAIPTGTNSIGKVDINPGNAIAVISGPTGTALNTAAYHLTTNTTTTVTSSTAYISSIVISASVVGTTSTVTIQDKQGTPLKIVSGLSTAVLITLPSIVNLPTPVKMTSGIDIVTAGAVAATVDVWINYFQ